MYRRCGGSSVTARTADSNSSRTLSSIELWAAAASGMCVTSMPSTASAVGELGHRSRWPCHDAFVVAVDRGERQRRVAAGAPPPSSGSGTTSIVASVPLARSISAARLTTRRERCPRTSARRRGAPRELAEAVTEDHGGLDAPGHHRRAHSTDVANTAGRERSRAAGRRGRRRGSSIVSRWGAASPGRSAPPVGRGGTPRSFVEPGPMPGCCAPHRGRGR